MANEKEDANAKADANAKDESKQNAVQPVESDFTAAEFKQLPLDFIIAAPLLTTIHAHRQAAETTLDFIKGLLNKNGQMDTVTFNMDVKKLDANQQESWVKRQVTVPLITLVKVPSLNFDSLSVSFNYNISQVVTEKRATNSKVNLEVGAKGILKGLIGASLTGSVEHTRSAENTSSRGGSLEIKLHVSESSMPAGLQKIVNALVENIKEEPLVENKK